MPANQPRGRSRLPLPVAEFHVLLALSDEDRYGHGIKLDIAERTAGEVVMGPGTLYGAIRRMVRRRLIEERLPARSGQAHDRRRYYGLTSLGKEVAAQEAERMKQLVEIAHAKRVVESWKTDLIVIP